MKPLVTLVVGARPNFMKAAALLGPLKAAGLKVRLVHTGQHEEDRMSGIFFRQLGLPKPDRHLGVGFAPMGVQTVRILERMDAELARVRPAMLLVLGDVTSTLAAALAASLHRIPLAHVEAGLRSFDRSMPEERNRVVVDHLSDLLFTTSADDDRNLRREGIRASRIFRAGDVLGDALKKSLPAARRAAPGMLRRMGLNRRGYALATLHRAENVDDPRRFKALMSSLERLASRLPLVFPVHPRIRQVLEGRRPSPGLRLLPPLARLDFLGLMDSSRAVLTDSGGVQREAMALGLPCLVLRRRSEWPLSRRGRSRLLPSPSGLGKALTEVLASKPSRRRPPGWDGKASVRIAQEISRRLAG